MGDQGLFGGLEGRWVGVLGLERELFRLGLSAGEGRDRPVRGPGGREWRECGEGEGEVEVGWRSEVDGWKGGPMMEKTPENGLHVFSGTEA